MTPHAGPALLGWRPRGPTGTRSSCPGEAAAPPHLKPPWRGLRERGAAIRRRCLLAAFANRISQRAGGKTRAWPEGARAPGLPGRVVLVPPEALAPTTCPVSPPRNGRRRRQKGKASAKADRNCSFLTRRKRMQLHFPSLPGVGHEGIAQVTMGVVVPAPCRCRTVGRGPAELKTTKMAAGEAVGRGYGSSGRPYCARVGAVEYTRNRRSEC